MKKKGFTLIELLAVIVILAIIAVIATPIIVGLIEDAREESFERSVEMILSATDLDFGMQESLENFTYQIENGVVTNLDMNVAIKNAEGFSGTIKYDEKGNSSFAINNGTLCMIKDSSGNVTTTDYIDGECSFIEYTDESCFTYIEVDGGVEITDYSDSCPRDVVIPDTLGGKTVVSIGERSFLANYDSATSSYLNQLTSVVIPNSVESIGMQAFGHNQLSGELNLSHLNKLKILGYESFGSNMLTSSIVPYNLTEVDCAFYRNVGAFDFESTYPDGTIYEWYKQCK